MDMKKWKHVALFAVLVILDQITKIWAKGALEGKKSISIIGELLHLQYLEGGNTGAAFGILNNYTWLLSIISFLVFLGIVWVIYKVPEEKKYNFLAITLVVLAAGAFGNLINRVIQNYVIDFIYFKSINFAIFNVADCYVTISAVTLFILFLFYYKEEDLYFFSPKGKMEKEQK